MADFDLAIIGGGINGTGLARDAAGRGLRVLLVEMNDLASGTSSASSKLIHGGLRYLERRAFRLLLRFGLLVYDWLGARKLLPASRTVDLTHHVMGQSLMRLFRYGFEYSDC